MDMTQLGIHVLLLFISKMTLDVLTYLESIVVVLEKTTVVLEVDSLEETDDPGVLALYLLKVIIIVGKGVQLWRLTLRLRTQVVTQLGMHEPSKSYLLQEMSHMVRILPHLKVHVKRDKLQRNRMFRVVLISVQNRVWVLSTTLQKTKTRDPNE